MITMLRLVLATWLGKLAHWICPSPQAYNKTLSNAKRPFPPKEYCLWLYVLSGALGLFTEGIGVAALVRSAVGGWSLFVNLGLGMAIGFGGIAIYRRVRS